MSTICYPSDAAVIGQSGHRSWDNWADVWLEGLCKSMPYRDLQSAFFLFFPHHLTIHSSPIVLTRPPVQDLEPGAAVSQENLVPPRAEGQTPGGAPAAACHLSAPVVQQPQGVSIRTPVLPHRHPPLSRAAEHQRTLRLWRAQETRLSW